MVFVLRTIRQHIFANCVKEFSGLKQKDVSEIHRHEGARTMHLLKHRRESGNN